MTARRTTSNKKRILSVLQRHHSCTARDIARMLPAVNESVIYRTLAAFIDDGIARSFSIGGEVHYELAEGAHDHFVCESCSLVSEVHCNRTSISRELPKGAHIGVAGVVVYGTCSMCAQNTQ